jgi:hypothetical protein
VLTILPEMTAAAERNFPMKTKTTITVETWKFESIRVNSECKRTLCCRCGAEAEPLSVFAAATKLNVTEAEIILRLRTGTIHLTGDGTSRFAQVCGGSLKQ